MWKVFGDEEGVSDAEGNLICDLMKGDRGSANLIAAAPDLLKACELALAHIEEREVVNLSDVLKAALKKAKGEE